MSAQFANYGTLSFRIFRRRLPSWLDVTQAVQLAALLKKLWNPVRVPPFLDSGSLHVWIQVAPFSSWSHPAVCPLVLQTLTPKFTLETNKGFRGFSLQKRQNLWKSPLFRACRGALLFRNRYIIRNRSHQVLNVRRISLTCEQVFPLQIDVVPCYWWSSLDIFGQFVFALMFEAV